MACQTTLNKDSLMDIFKRPFDFSYRLFLLVLAGKLIFLPSNEIFPVGWIRFKLIFYILYIKILLLAKEVFEQMYLSRYLVAYTTVQDNLPGFSVQLGKAKLAYPSQKSAQSCPRKPPNVIISLDQLVISYRFSNKIFVGLNCSLIISDRLVLFTQKLPSKMNKKRAKASQQDMNR